ncbi:hypothetical protein AnigIFM56816_007984 [Aspergillus niger]|nr:hypothetical protein AnigIFM56816_007984 [Aspergillus niger]
MNVFDEEPSTITLSTPKASTTGTTIAIILEELRLPYTLHILPHSSSTTTLTDIHRTGHGPTLHSLPSITTYLLTRYDGDHHHHHHLSYPPHSPEHVAVQESLSKLADRMGITHHHLHHQDSEPDNKHEHKHHHNKQHLPAIKETEVVDNNNNTAKETATATVPFARRLLSLYLHLEEYLSRQRRGGGGWLIGERCTVADIAHFPYVAAASQYGFDLERFPELTGWYDRMMRRHGVRKGWERVHLEGK